MVLDEPRWRPSASRTLIDPLPAAVLGVFCAFAVVRGYHRLRSKLSGESFAGNLEPGWARPVWILLIVGLVSGVICFGFHHTSEHCPWMGWFTISLWAPVRWIGFGIAVLSLLGLNWVHLTLGRYFSANLALREDHQLIRLGPYALVRHPMYSALLGFFGGAAILSANAVIIAFCLGIGSLLLWRIDREERMLEERFADEYRQYRTQTGRLLPRVSRLLK